MYGGNVYGTAELGSHTQNNAAELQLGIYEVIILADTYFPAWSLLYKQGLVVTDTLQKHPLKIFLEKITPIDRIRLILNGVMAGVWRKIDKIKSVWTRIIKF